MNTNGSGNGKDPDKDKIVKFPTLAERDRMRREERVEEERWRKEYKKQSKANKKNGHEPFFNFGNIPPFIGTLIASFIIIHLIMSLLLNDAVRLEAFYTFGFVPAMYTGGFEWMNTAYITPITHAFIHGGWMHLFFNVVMGLALGIFFERLTGPKITAIFFALCTLSGAALYFAFSPDATTPVIGASGGISGLFAAFIYITMTSQENHPITQRFGKYGPWPILGFWALLIVIPGLIFQNIAWHAHLGGYAAGILFVLAMRKGFIRF